MRTIKTEQTIPTTTFVEETYGCEACDFTSDTTEDIGKHMAEKHSFAEEKVAGGVTFLRFDTEEQFKAYRGSEMFRGATDKAYWKGAGWYRFWLDIGPCARGCCTTDYIYSELLEQRIVSIQEQIDALKEQLQSLQAGFTP